MTETENDFPKDKRCEQSERGCCEETACQERCSLRRKAIWPNPMPENEGT